MYIWQMRKLLLPLDKDKVVVCKNVFKTYCDGKKKVAQLLLLFVLCG